MDERRRGARRWWARGGASVAAALALGCGTVTVDLGSNYIDAGTDTGTGSTGGGGGASPVATATCLPLTDLQLDKDASPPCPATCADAFGEAHVVSSGGDLEAWITGRWLTCSGAPPWDVADDGAVGLEFQAGCTLFVLYDGGDAGILRGNEQGTYDVVETPSGAAVTRSLALHFVETGTWSVTPTMSDCPYRLRLVPEGGPELDFAGITDTPNPAM